MQENRHHFAVSQGPVLESCFLGVFCELFYSHAHRLQVHFYQPNILSTHFGNMGGGRSVMTLWKPFSDLK